MTNSPAMRAAYYAIHAACPTCLTTDHESTCMGVLILGPESQDTNAVKCCKCGWKGICHDMVPDPQAVENRRMAERAYYAKHQVCPRCHAACSFFPSDHGIEGPSIAECTMRTCGWVGTVDEMIPKPAP